MNREIKFRAWDKRDKKMHSVACINYDNHGSYEVRYHCFTEYMGKDRFILMQFTGLQDKNGKEIYEGDIVKHIYFDDDLQKECYYLLFVKYGYYTHLQTDDGHLGFYLETFFDSAEPKNKISDVQCSLIDYESCCKNEVIGNIFENENLLK